MKSLKRKILLLEDDELFASSLIDFLEDNDFDIVWSKNGIDALDKVFNNNFDLLLLDINTPQLSGVDFLINLKESNINIPAIFITSYNQNSMIMKCFKVGCDDYITKPFEVNELVARINVVINRNKSPDDKIYFNDNCYFDTNNRLLMINNTVTTIPLKITLLLEACIEQNNKILTNEYIISKLWNSSEEYSEGSIRIYINKLRALIGKEHIITIRKIGYSIKI